MGVIRWRGRRIDFNVGIGGVAMVMVKVGLGLILVFFGCLVGGGC